MSRGRGVAPRVIRRSAGPSQSRLAKKAAKKKAKKKAAAEVSAAKTKPSAPRLDLAPLEKAIEIFHKQDYAKAAEAFRKLESVYADELGVLDRVRMYIAICGKKLDEAPPNPKSADDHYNLGVLRLNEGNLEEAAQLLEKALSMEKDSDRAHYALAVAHALGENNSKALEHLRRAIESNPDNRIHAISDSDLVLLRDEDEFLELTAAPPEPASPDRQVVE